MFKKFAIAAPLALLAITSTGAFAAGEASHSISLVAHVPTNGFYVVPTDPDLVNKDQDMSYQPTTGKMAEVNGFFDVRNNNGSVHASLESLPKLVAGSTSIDLQVMLNNKELTTTPQMVVGEAESDVNYRAPLKISAKGSNFQPGDYTGSVAMIFDAVPPIGGN
ncbi:fimbrial assembly protein [Pseudomonas koreensis]|uniref:Fimbrial assembly protein n=2 Tax=Pseudomonas TaxID=286 RepID=A0A4Q4LBG9_9PSED|nr:MULTISPECIES: CS1 type fimbrial major subunit [Pseudomonas]WKV83237.1 CS1 type fimbrial major subunit [Pseudomonas sp. B24_DOA]WKV88804.1 CS1 type fimbrial major subunit [Pseudomonas sp. B21_DOA]KIF63956.1 CS1 type fimbrial major subunit [Pseudomonas fluorescens]MDM8193894.1 CS1 type fimbrial major subunit [Pseudomonas fluorescens]MDP8575139.1 CS1 type fimbrial major subunit [Pseudomonas iranensis]